MSQTTDPTRAIGYVRVSAEDQAREGGSLDVQAVRIRAYCEAKGWPLEEIVRDEGRSARDLNRPAIARVLELARKHNGSRTCDEVVVLKLDRLTRTVKDLGTVMYGGSLGSSPPHGRWATENHGPMQDTPSFTPQRPTDREPGCDLQGAARVVASPAAIKGGGPGLRGPKGWPAGPLPECGRGASAGKHGGRGLEHPPRRTTLPHGPCLSHIGIERSKRLKGKSRPMREGIA